MPPVGLFHQRFWVGVEVSVLLAALSVVLGCAGSGPLLGTLPRPLTYPWLLYLCGSVLNAGFSLGHVDVPC